VLNANLSKLDKSKITSLSSKIDKMLLKKNLSVKNKNLLNDLKSLINSKVEKEKVVKEVATEVDQKVVDTKAKVQAARTAVETKYKKKQITKAQYEEKMKRIDEIEKDVQRIETERQATDKVIKAKVS
jgi:myosin heavy subunit